MKNIAFTPEAYADYLNWLKTDKKIFLKITETTIEVVSCKYHYK